MLYALCSMQNYLIIKGTKPIILALFKALVKIL